MYCVYVIESQKNFYLYKGFSSNINKGIKDHNAGLVELTKNQKPWKLIYCEFFISKEDALEREKYFKSGWGRKSLNKILKNYFKNK